MSEDGWDVDAILSSAGFDEDAAVLTRRQAEVLALRERGASQAEIADLLGTSRANVSGVESAARDNVDRARETVAVAAALAAPVQVTVEADTDLYDVPEAVYSACDESGVKVAHTGADLLNVLSETVPGAVEERTVVAPLTVSVGADGEVHVRRRGDGEGRDDS
jgi:Tfx family DNA-binding protein